MHPNFSLSLKNEVNTLIPKKDNTEVDNFLKNLK